MNTYADFARMVATLHDAYLLDYGPEEQAERAVEALEHFHRTTPMTPVTNLVVDLAGFGEVPLRFASVLEDEHYFLASDLGEQLGWPLHKIDAQLRKEYAFAVTEQRTKDEARGDGRLGWELMRDYLDLGLSLVMDDPEANPDAGGRRWSHAGDWLISTDRLPLMLSRSPWGKEYVDNTIDAWCHGMQKIHGTNRLTAVDQEGNPLPEVRLFHTDLSEDEALRKARRGPSAPGVDTGEDGTR